MAMSLPPKPVGLTPVGRRGHYRHQIQTLAYVNLDQANGGVIRNLGDAGMAIQAVTPLYVNQQVVLRFDLPNPRVRLEATGRIAWADPVGQAGVEFLTVSQRARRQLREWIFVQLMASAEHAAGDATYLYGKSGQEAAELVFSAHARPAIRLEAKTAAAHIGEDRNNSRRLHLSWLPFAISAIALSRLVDGLILFSALLLFALICIAMVGSVPAWPVSVVVGLGASAVFTLLYRFLFLFWIGGTPGHWLAGLTGDGCDGIELEERPRFR